MIWLRFTLDVAFHSKGDTEANAEYADELKRKIANVIRDEGLRVDELIVDVYP